MMQATAVALQEMQLWCSSKPSLWMPLQLASQLFLCTAAHASLQVYMQQEHSVASQLTVKACS